MIPVGCLMYRNASTDRSSWVGCRKRFIDTPGVAAKARPHLFNIDVIDIKYKKSSFVK